MQVLNTILPVVQEILVDFKQVFSTYTQQSFLVAKKYTLTYAALLGKIYEELHDSSTDETVPLFLIASMLIVFIFGATLFIFALLQ